MLKIIISATTQKRDAQLFNLASIFAILFLPIFPIILIWIALSIFIYAKNINHPNPKISSYTRSAGYRFYFTVGSLMIALSMSGIIIFVVGSFINMFLILWALAFFLVVPLGIRDILRVRSDIWASLEVDLNAIELMDNQ